MACIWPFLPCLFVFVDFGTTFVSFIEACVWFFFYLSLIWLFSFCFLLCLPMPLSIPPFPVRHTVSPWLRCPTTNALWCLLSRPTKKISCQPTNLPSAPSNARAPCGCPLWSIMWLHANPGWQFLPAGNGGQTGAPAAYTWRYHPLAVQPHPHPAAVQAFPGPQLRSWHQWECVLRTAENIWRPSWQVGHCWIFFFRLP